MRKLSILLFVFSISLLLKSQDIHFSQFNQSYLNLNPGNTGLFNGDYRLNANYKNQWSSVTTPYRTFSFAADAKSPIKKWKFLNLGVMFFNDDAGTGGLRTTQFSLSLAYLKALNKDSTLFINTGVQVGMISRAINFSALSFDQQYQNGSYNSSRASGENFDRNSYANLDLNLGFTIMYVLKPRQQFEFGIAAFNLNAANQSFLGEQIPLDKRWNFNAKADFLISDKIDLIPSLLYSRQGTFYEVLMGSNLRYRMSNSSFFKRNLYGGIWYRNKDALILSTGMDYNQWRLGLSYDINLSDLDKASRNQGGIEIAITYIIKTFKPSKSKYLKCPKFL